MGNGTFSVFAKNNSQQSGSISNIVIDCTPTTTTTTTLGPNIPTNGLKLYLNANISSSLPGLRQRWFDLSGNNNDFIYALSQSSGAPYESGSFLVTGTSGNWFYNTSSVFNLTASNQPYSIVIWHKTIANSGPNFNYTYGFPMYMMSKQWGYNSGPGTTDDYKGWSFGYGPDSLAASSSGLSSRVALLGSASLPNDSYTMASGNIQSAATTSSFVNNSTNFVLGSVTYDGTNQTNGVAGWKLYLNGNQIATSASLSSTSSLTPANTAPTYIGGRARGVEGNTSDMSANRFNGYISSVLWYDRALTNSEITQIYLELSQSFNA